MARKFLWIVAILASLAIAIRIIWLVADRDLMRFAFVPGDAYGQTELAAAPNYAEKASWIARPDIAGNPALWTPAGFTAGPRPASAAFYIAPTAWLGRSRWNSPLDDPETNDRLDKFTKMQASVFNGVAAVWAPRYRQATFGSFLKPSADSVKALDLAYTDVLRAFDAFLAAQPADRPIILAGHSQGGLHLLRLIKDRKAALSNRLVAAYVVGWPVAMPDDPAALGLPACETAGQAGCIASWQSFAADGDLEQALKGFDAIPDVSGKPLGTRPMLCVNPLSGGSAPADVSRNVGTLIDQALVPRKLGARCNERGLLLIAPTPRDVGPFVLSGGNFHVYDFSLFWANIRADVEARLSSYGAAHLAPAPAPTSAPAP